jgi:hypothetical protein
MAAQEYDAIFVGGGLATLLLLKEFQSELPERVAVIEPSRQESSSDVL